MLTTPRLPDLVALEVFVTTARCGSMGAAARELGLSQQAVSARIRACETILGCALFRRSRRGVELTDAGRSIVAWAEDVLAAAAALAEGVASLAPRSHTSAHVAVSNTISECLLPRWATQLRQTYPGHIITVAPSSSEEVIDAVRGGRAALGFVECPTLPDDLAHHPVGSDDLVVVVPPDHPWAQRRGPITRRMLATTALVMRAAGSGTRSTLRGALGELVPPLLELSSNAAVRDAVLATGAPAVLSSLAVRRQVETGAMVRVRVRDLHLPRTLHAVWNPHQRPKGAAADLLRVATGG